MKPVGNAGEGGRTERARSLVAASQLALPRCCAALCCWSRSLHSPGDPLGEEERFREEMPGKNGERRNASALMSLLAVGSVLLSRLDVPFLGCLLLACKAKPYVWGTRLALRKVGAKGAYAIGVW